ncbi:uncharacterized protein LOC114732958 [Neltuma alba]|uniref:uncharacterized protein LOC114732958 n=1 Tax=Neltuma alba TaxID=207710 RepID=UPI0010A3F15C|nr:uncharacterized protein LOC114732958 [Prosopis alba]
MSHNRLQQSSPDQIKAPRFFLISENPRDIFVILIRLGVLVCLVVSITLALYSAFFKPSRWFFPDRLQANARAAAEDERPAPTNISHILFCIAGSENTWQERSRFNKLWWLPNDTRGFVWLDKEPRYDVSGAIPFKISNYRWKSFVHGQAAVRISRIFKESFKLGLPNVRWFVMGDDDTVFFPANLATVLGKYDHREMVYIGDNSESVEQNLYHGFAMAYGGGGFAISSALAIKLSRIFDGCLRRYYYFYGSDQRVWACVNELGVTLTREPGFHQLDIKGDPYGILAAHPLAPLVSLHHLDMLEPVFPNMTQVDAIHKLMAAYLIDPSRILQQCFCYDHKRHWSVSISWGYTAQIYPTLWTAKDLQTRFRTFRTWGTLSDGPFMFSTRPMGPDPCDKPIVYFLEKVKRMGNGAWSFSSYKKHREGEDARNCTRLSITPVEVDRVRVAALKLDPKYWKKETTDNNDVDLGGNEAGPKEAMLSNNEWRRNKEWDTAAQD